MRHAVLGSILLILACRTSAQLNFDYTAGRFMIKGMVVDIDSKKPIPLANVLVTNRGKGITCDNDGTFTLYVSKNDTLKFSSTGYLKKVIHVADIDPTKYYTLQIQLIHDFIKLKEVTIYPFRDLDDFKQAFINNRDQNGLLIPGLAPKYHGQYHSKFYNPISFLYDKIKRRSSANPDFKP